MKVGVLIPPVPGAAADYDRVVEHARAAEAKGFASAWVLEEHGSSPFVLAAALAAETGALRLAVVAAPAAGHPLRLAEDGAVVDLLCGGRLIFAADPGAEREEAGGAPGAERWERFCEALDVVVTAWTREGFAYLGKFHRLPLRTRAASTGSPGVPEPYRAPYALPWQRAGLPFDYLSVLPKPAQIPRPPVFVVGRDARAVALAARRGFSLFLAADSPAERLREDGRLYWREVERAGREPQEVVLAVAASVFVEADGDSARRRARGAPGRVLAGSPGEVFDAIKTLQQETGAGHLVCALHLPGLSADRVLGSLELFAAEVATRLEL